MTLATSGEISLGGSTATRSINLELGLSATAQISLNDTNVRTLAGVASGAIVVPTDFYGKSAATVNFTDHYIYAFGASGPATALYEINANGQDYEGINGVLTAYGAWVSPTSAGGNYEVFATVTAGSLSSGTTGSWVATSTSPQWTRVRGGPPGSGVLSATLSMQVRAVGSATVLDTWTIDLVAER